ncbi:MAG TPA: polymer-forming cytoskeletal protein [Gemmatimonadales bacterium]|nr:polymer-forming cytoskeletal protein [Gemmatimonadales bacterium]
MHPGRWATVGLLTLCLGSVDRVHATVTPEPSATNLVDRVRNLLPFLVTATTLTPQAVEQAPAGGATVDPTHLDMPERLEHDLREAITDPIGQTRLTVVGGTARLGNYSLGSTETHHGHLVVLKGNAEIHGRLEGNLVTLDGDVVLHPGAAVVGDVLAINGRIRGDPGAITGSSSTLQPREVVAHVAVPALIGRRSLGLLAVLATFTVLGFALVTFGRPNLEIVSDTVMHSFGRSFTAGLLAQVLLLPTFGMLVVGLVLTVAGALLVPFAAAVYVILAIVAVLGGVIAVAHAMGETITRRRMARGLAVSPNAYRYVATGLMGMAGIWLAWTIAGWVPVAGPLTFLLAALATWLVATVGFGAALLSRGGIREDFAGRLLPAAMMTDEYLWATPMVGVPAVKRPPTADR